MAGAILASGGCSTGGRHASNSRAVRGYANLDVLVRSHPGWAGLAQYDQALARVEAVALRPTNEASADASLVTLPPASVTLDRLPPALALEGERKRLNEVLQRQVAHLRERQAQGRERQIALDAPRWDREAAAEYASAVSVAETKYTDELSRLAADQDARRLNLLLQIRALRTIVLGWDKSTPPTPKLNQARIDLATKRNQLAALDSNRRLLAAKASSERDVEIAAAAKRRSAYVARLVSNEKATLLPRDEEQVGSLRTRLGDELGDLLRQEEALSVPSVPPVGSLAAQQMPPEPAMVVVSPGAAHSLRLTEGRLRQQRARWLEYLYSDTRAAVKDVAQQRHWTVTFGQPSFGERNLTAPLAQALTAHEWKS